MYIIGLMIAVIIMLSTLIGFFTIIRWLYRKINKKEKIMQDKIEEKNAETMEVYFKKEKLKREILNLNAIFSQKSFSWFILGLSLLLMFIENFLKMDSLVGGWHIVSYCLLLLPLGYMAFKNQLTNPYVKWFFPVLLVMIIDMFYYSNEMVQQIVPIVFYVLVAVLYLTSMHKVHSFYQTIVAFLPLSTFKLDYVNQFFTDLLLRDENRELYKRIGIALLITVPFLGVFIALLGSADESFSNFLMGLVDFSFNFDIRYIFTVPFYFTLYLLLFVIGFSATQNRTQKEETVSFDMLIVGIFLGMINLLFLMFVLMNLPFLFGEANLPAHTTLAEFAREGFFQLMMVMGLVLLIFMFIMRRFKGEKLFIFFLGALLVQTIVMGLISLKKMYLYQSIKGVTVLRYYVEWFDYFLILVLALGVFFLIKKINFSKLLDIVSAMGIVAFTLIISLNIDAMVASHNLEKFKETPKELDKYALSQLSIDALPAIQGTDIVLKSSTKRWCGKFSNYHLGYCMKLNTYGNKQYQFEDTSRVRRER